MADGDEVPAITDHEDAAWAADQRKVVEHYLQAYERVWEKATPYGKDEAL